MIAQKLAELDFSLDHAAFETSSDGVNFETDAVLVDYDYFGETSKEENEVGEKEDDVAAKTPVRQPVVPGAGAPRRNMN